MPEAGRTPEANFKRGDSLAYGEAGAANSLAGLAPTVKEPEPYNPSGDEEEFLYAQTDRPEEPLTQGVPVGAGSDFTRHAIETGSQFKERLLAQMEQQGASKDVRAFIERARRGL